MQRFCRAPCHRNREHKIPIHLTDDGASKLLIWAHTSNTETAPEPEDLKSRRRATNHVMQVQERARVALHDWKEATIMSHCHCTQ